MRQPTTQRRRPQQSEHGFKHLIFLFDGTWNSAAAGTYKDITNVFHLNIAFNLDDGNGMPQIVFYSPGPGTRGFIDRQLGGVFGLGIDQIIKEAYVNLCSNYWPGDKIHIFGYSRGAVAARALTGLISKCGLLRVEEISSLWEVWQHFIDRRFDLKNNSIPPSISRHTWEETPKTSFLGLFDCVLGRNYHDSDIFRKLRFHDNKVDANVETAVQLLSIDDDRKVFQPILWDGQHGPSSVEQIWIPGVHGDLGGLGDTFLGDVAFLTMVDRVRKKRELDLDQNYVRSFLDRLRNKERISISNERADAKMRALRRVVRSPPSNEYENKIHPAFKLICGQKIYVRGRRKKYSCLIDSAFTDLPTATTAFDSRVEAAFFQVMQRMGP